MSGLRRMRCKRRYPYLQCVTGSFGVQSRQRWVTQRAQQCSDGTWQIATVEFFFLVAVPITVQVTAHNQHSGDNGISHNRRNGWRRADSHIIQRCNLKVIQYNRLSASLQRREMDVLV